MGWDDYVRFNACKGFFSLPLHSDPVSNQNLSYFSLRPLNLMSHKKKVVSLKRLHFMTWGSDPGLLEVASLSRMKQAQHGKQPELVLPGRKQHIFKKVAYTCSTHRIDFTKEAFNRINKVYRVPVLLKSLQHEAKGVVSL
jgi:hypothetical protein